MAYTLHFRCSKQDILPWVIEGINPFETIGSTLDYRILMLDTHIWNFDLVFANRDQSQEFLVKLMTNSLSSTVEQILKKIRDTHPTAKEVLTSS